MDKNLEKAAKKGDAPAIKKLIMTGASVVGADKSGNTLLHLAAKSGSLDASKLLLDAGCDAAQRNAKGQTPLDLAEKKKNKNLIMLFRSIMQQQSLGIGKGSSSALSGPSSSLSFVPFFLLFFFNSLKADTTQHNTTQHNTTQHNTTQHNTTQSIP